MVTFYNPRRHRHGHGVPAPARAPCPPFYYYKKVRCMRRMCRCIGQPLPEVLCFITLSESGRRALNSNVPRMCPNVPECATNVPPNVPTGAVPSQNHMGDSHLFLLVAAAVCAPRNFLPFGPPRPPFSAPKNGSGPCPWTSF